MWRSVRRSGSILVGSASQRNAGAAAAAASCRARLMSIASGPGVQQQSKNGMFLLPGAALVLGGVCGIAATRDPSYSLNVYDLDIEGSKFPREVPVFIEVSKFSRMKYEWDKQYGMLHLDRVLHSAVFYPWDYGFIPQTLCEDGDPLDVLVMGDTPLEPGCIVDVRVLGYMVMEDEKGKDEKVLACLVKDPRFADYRTLRDVPEHVLREIAQFFETYKVLEREKWVKVGGWKGLTDTHDLVFKTHKAYLDKKANEAAPHSTAVSDTTAPHPVPTEKPAAAPATPTKKK